MVCTATARNEGGFNTNTSLFVTDLPRQPVHPQVLSDTGTHGTVDIALNL